MNNVIVVYPQSSAEVDQRWIATDHVLGTDGSLLGTINLHSHTSQSL